MDPSTPVLEIDERYVAEMASLLCTVPTDVPEGFETYTPSDDPKIVHYIQNVIRPELYRIGVFELIDVPRNNLVVRLGSGTSGKSILLQTYPITQHFQHMSDPFSGRIAIASSWGVDEPCVFGRGATQKIHQAVMLAVLKAIKESNRDLTGYLYWAINGEGRSTHDCTTSILDVLPDKPGFAVLQVRPSQLSSESFLLSLGNRGRVDIDVHIVGKAAHSSRPDLAQSAIDGFGLFLDRLRELNWSDSHPLLGSRQAVPYKVRFSPVAPHTLPSEAFITVDRRLLPGDDIDDAVSELSDAIGDLPPFSVTVSRGVAMLPALVDPDSDAVSAVRRAFHRVTGQELRTTYHAGTFDAGGTASAGIPTVMFGTGGGARGQWPLGEDFVPISAIVTEARVLAELILSELG